MGIFSKLKQAFAGKDDQDRYLSGLDKSRRSFSQRIRNLALNFTGVNEEFLEELMIVLLEADIGIRTAEKIIERVETRAMDEKLKKFDEISECLIEVMAEMYEEAGTCDDHVNENGPTVVLMVGVNGSGKTTTTAKLTKLYQEQRKKVVLAAADTFRAGAVDQLAMWADRLNVPCIKGREGGDPSAVLVDACRYALEEKADYLIGDTAGRLQNKANLMKELEKMKRVVGREIDGAPHEVWLVIDATTGQNGISQAQVFLETTAVTGIILTKLDGTAKGGIVFAIRDQLGLPVKFIGLGEHPDDLRPFDLQSYLYSLCEGMLEDHD
ncbi:signal recognition particle-docking protein FtsY [Clostridiaceae bacterium DONG20-135]|uniref:Signal recognition particle receptor FtsY n=1 Tax=Copranaerobaculum intestinale TaxID=2692629 RepID=A0A6N8U5X8_9FIRM|nr:signal recognition particle-docking protein FtsY [Copranaerobaculum intestinale]MXQ73606.1 signal recognition particle-docking protein FtsY [Copranaerobaculum intestinale]